MLRRYLVALIGAVVGGGIAFAVFYVLGYYPGPFTVALCAFGVAGFFMAKGEDLGLVPRSEEIGKPTTLFSDDKGERR